MTRFALCLLPVLFLLHGCALDREAKVRARLSAWIELGETYFFESSTSCTAAVFHTENPRISSLLEKARSVDTGLRMLAENKPLVFSVAGKSPNALSEEIMSRDLPRGIGLLSSGLAGLNCMTGTVKSVYYRAIMNPASKLAFLPDSGAVMVVDPQALAVIYVRGNG